MVSVLAHVWGVCDVCGVWRVSHGAHSVQLVASPTQTEPTRPNPTQLTPTPSPPLAPHPFHRSILVSAVIIAADGPTTDKTTDLWKARRRVPAQRTLHTRNTANSDPNQHLAPLDRGQPKLRPDSTPDANQSFDPIQTPSKPTPIPPPSHPTPSQRNLLCADSG